MMSVRLHYDTAHVRKVGLDMHVECSPVLVHVSISITLIGFWSWSTDNLDLINVHEVP